MKLNALALVLVLVLAPTITWPLMAGGDKQSTLSTPIVKRKLAETNSSASPVLPAPAQDRSNAEVPAYQRAVHDHRKIVPQPLRAGETRLNLREGHPLHLRGGASLIQHPRGVLELRAANQLRMRTFQNAMLVKDGSGVVWIVSPGNIVGPNRSSGPNEIIATNNMVSPNNVSDGQRVRAGTVADLQENEKHQDISF